MKNLEKNKFYFIKVKHYGRELEYRGKIMWIHGDEFRMQCEDDCRLRFKLKQVFYIRELNENEIKKIEYKPLQINQKRVFIPRHKLKKMEEPEGLN
ncbi:MAG: hypothetical protein KC516_02640 [Nanoarchaeota archaeon]|nr:hypothetical protein [Nanoarchaeota archaeon]